MANAGHARPAGTWGGGAWGGSFRKQRLALVAGAGGRASNGCVRPPASMGHRRLQARARSMALAPACKLRRCAAARAGPRWLWAGTTAIQGLGAGCLAWTSTRSRWVPRDACGGPWPHASGWSSEGLWAAPACKGAPRMRPLPPHTPAGPTLLAWRTVYLVQSFEALNQRAVAVVVDPVQSVKGKVRAGGPPGPRAAAAPMLRARQGRAMPALSPLRLVRAASCGTPHWPKCDVLAGACRS